MRRGDSEKERASSISLDEEDEGQYFDSGTGEIVTYLILLAILFALTTNGWIYDLWSPF
jgi:hypothetical protein